MRIHCALARKIPYYQLTSPTSSHTTRPTLLLHTTKHRLANLLDFTDAVGQMIIPIHAIESNNY
jgi:hypothetical protein